MAVHVRYLWNASVLLVDDDLDLHTSAELRANVYLAGLLRPKLIVSLEDCGYCDLSGLRTLCDAKRWFGERLDVVIPPAHMARRILAIVEWQATLSPCASLGEALVRCATTDGAV